MKKIFTFLLLSLSLLCNAQWTLLPLEQNNLQSLYFIDDNIGYVGTQSSEEELPKLFKTTDGGMNWVEIALPDVGDYTEIVSIHFWDENTGFLTTDDMNNNLITTDGGETWTTINPGSEYAGKSYFKDDGTGFYYTDSIEDNLFYTDDWGATWILKDSFYLIHNINFISNQSEIGYMHTEWSTYKTTDGGNTWESIASIGEGTGNVFFYNENIGYIGMDYGLFKTTNGGDDWENIFFYANKKVFFINENVGFNISYSSTNSGNRLYKTLDGGENWQQMYILGTEDYLTNVIDFDFPSGDVAYAITTSGNIYKLDVAASTQSFTNNSVSIYPNPVTTTLNITNASELTSSKYIIIDINGKTVSSGILSKKTIDINQLEQGVYFLKIEDKQSVKFIKK